MSGHSTGPEGTSVTITSEEVVVVSRAVWHALAPEDVLEQLGSSGETGLTDSEVADRLAHYVLCFGYLLMLFGFLAAHRTINNSNAIGMLSMITLIAAVKMSDAFAYFSGKTFGKNKMAPNLSPKKSNRAARN